MDGLQIDGLMNGWIDRWMNGWVVVRMGECMTFQCTIKILVMVIFFMTLVLQLTFCFSIKSWFSENAEEKHTYHNKCYNYNRMYL